MQEPLQQLIVVLFISGNTSTKYTKRPAFKNESREGLAQKKKTFKDINLTFPTPLF
jgi:hypothetical protein